jgi:hypothetical protein
VGAAFAQSASTPPPTFSTREQNLDANGFIRVRQANWRISRFCRRTSLPWNQPKLPSTRVVLTIVNGRIVRDELTPSQ